MCFNASQPDRDAFAAGGSLQAALSLGSNQGLLGTVLLMVSSEAVSASLKRGRERETAIIKAGIFSSKVSPVKGNPLC